MSIQRSKALSFETILDKLTGDLEETCPSEERLLEIIEELRELMEF